MVFAVPRGFQIALTGDLFFSTKGPLRSEAQS
jgi:hypothetical protein